MAESDNLSTDRRIVIYKNESEVPGDVGDGEVLPVYRGDGPREGDFMGRARVDFTSDGATLTFLGDEREDKGGHAGKVPEEEMEGDHTEGWPD
jgi:hypothetical protein